MVPSPDGAGGCRPVPSDGGLVGCPHVCLVRVATIGKGKHMGFSDWAVSNDVQEPGPSLGLWLEWHEDARMEIESAWRSGYDAEVITRYLSDEWAVEFPAKTVQGWLTNVVGVRGAPQLR